MQCSSPVHLSYATVSCGQCMACRVNKSRLWTSKLLMESMHHPAESNWFATLTYDDDSAPRTTDGRLTLTRRDGQLFVKRLRTHFGAVSRDFRFFLCGEYGDVTERPHYHMIGFGFPSWSEHIPKLIESKWGLGFTRADYVSPARMAYVSQYCTKKITGKAADNHYGSRLPEFSQMSRRPALGDRFIECFSAKVLADYVRRSGDVPSQYRWEGAIWPFSQRHRSMMRKRVGLPLKRMEVVALNPLLQEIEREREVPSIDELRARRIRETQVETRSKIYRRSAV